MTEIEPARATEAAATPRQRVALILVAACAATLTYVGWRAFWFLTDDAFIAFRYASNSLLGRGYVWNPAPFAPVEGYTSFLWTFLLRHLWALTGIAPEVTANGLSLGLGYVTLALGARMLWQMPLPPRVARYRIAWLSLVLLATLSNRTFLTWLSSGLETSLFNCALTYWAFAGTRPRGGRRLWHLTLSCTLIALTRPDGLLFAAASLLLIADELVQVRRRSMRASHMLACTPLLAIGAHLAFRVQTYGEWVPNTYYAKIVRSWPAAGGRYLLSFALEYAAWWWALCALVWLGMVIARARPAQLASTAAGVAPAIVVVGTLLLHLGYYVLVVGGDHFEYRILSHLPLLLALALVPMLAQLRDSPRFVALLFVTYLSLSLPIPWTHYQRTHAFTDAQFRHRLRVKIAQDFPPLLRGPVELWDETQHWLINHAIGSRHIEHKLFCERMQRHAPPRGRGAELSWDERPVHAAEAVGVVGYRLPHVAVIDLHGLSDRVIARTPPPENTFRKMAHERLPPPGYAECFRPNVFVDKGRVRVDRRKKPLSDARILECEALDRWVKVARIKAQHNVPAAITLETPRVLRRVFDDGLIHPHHLPLLDQSLTEMTSIQSGCERTKSTPFCACCTPRGARPVAMPPDLGDLRIRKVVGDLAAPTQSRRKG